MDYIFYLFAMYRTELFYSFIIGLELYILWGFYKFYCKHKTLIDAHYLLILYMLLIDVVLFFPKILYMIPKEILLIIYYALIAFCLYIFIKDTAKKIKEKGLKNLLPTIPQIVEGIVNTVIFMILNVGVILTFAEYGKVGIFVPCAYAGTYFLIDKFNLLPWSSRVLEYVAMIWSPVGLYMFLDFLFKH